MGELHLEIYVERMKREYNCECATGKPQVAFRETVSCLAKFDYTHKRQTGGAGQFAKVIGHIGPLDAESGHPAFHREFVNNVIGGTVPTSFIPACEKGFLEACEKGSLVGHPIVGIQFVLEDGQAHIVDSSENAFRTASILAVRSAYAKANPQVLEPIMRVSVSAPIEFQGSVLGLVTKRRGVILDTDCQEEYVTLTVDAPLNDMFGFSTDLRSTTQGKGEFTMEYKEHLPVPFNVQQQLVAEYQKKINSTEKKQ